MNIINGIRKNIGTVIAGFGFLLLCIITFGDLAEIATREYWLAVGDNLTSIGMMTVALTMIKVSIKQGVAEQALQRGLNTENTKIKWEEHRGCIKENTPRLMYMPYFLQIYNERQTVLERREFLINNNFLSEQALMASGKRWMIKKYNAIKVHLTVARIKWATTDIVKNKHGQIITLSEYRAKRLVKGIVFGAALMIGVTLLTTGLFFSQTDAPVWQKFVKLCSYILTTAMFVLYDILKNYEKGAFGIPNDLEELNCIWNEFKNWKTPEWVLTEVGTLNECPREVAYGKAAANKYTEVPQQPQKDEVVQDIIPDSFVVVSGFSGAVSDTGAGEHVQRPVRVDASSEG